MQGIASSRYAKASASRTLAEGFTITNFPPFSAQVLYTCAKIYALSTSKEVTSLKSKNTFVNPLTITYLL